jgi:hypothetical protein
LIYIPGTLGGTQDSSSNYLNYSECPNAGHSNNGNIPIPEELEPFHNYLASRNITKLKVKK